MQTESVSPISTQNKLQNSFDLSNAGLAQTNAAGEFIAVNNRFCSLTGYSQQELLQRRLVDILHPDDKAAIQERIITCINEGRDFSSEQRYLQKDGSVVWVANTASLLSVANGGSLLSIISIDVTDAKAQQPSTQDYQQDGKAYGQLRETESWFRALVEETPVATSLFAGRDMVVAIANNAMLKVWGKDASVIGKPLRQALPELEGQPFHDLLDEVFTTGKTYEAKDAPATLKVDGKLGTYYFDFAYKPLFNSAGEVYGVMDIAIDVTDKVLAQRKADEVQHQILSSFEEAPAGIAVIEKEGLTFRAANPFYGELVGRKPAEIINKPLLEALPELQGQGFDKLLEQVINTGTAYSANEV